jgi:hypothetical protein
MVAHKYVNPLDPPYKPEPTPSPATDGKFNIEYIEVTKEVIPPHKPDTRTVVVEEVSEPQAPVNASTSTSTSIPTDSDIEALGELINALTPDELAKLRIIAKQVAPEIAEAVGIDSNIRKLANGMIEAKIILSPDVIEMLIPWSESAQKSLGETIQDVAEMAITSLLSTDWGAIVPQAVAPPAVKV